VNALQYLRHQGLEWTSATCATVASMGHLQLQQLRQHGCPWDDNEIGIKAARSGNVQMLQWLSEQGIVFNERTIGSAASCGHIAACEYLRFTEQCPWNTHVCMSAAEANHLDVLVWLREHGCPCDDQPVSLLAARGGSVEVMSYMLEQLQQLDAAIRTVLLLVMLAIAGANNQLVAAQWLRAQGAVWPAVLRYPVNGEQQQWRGAVLEWARSEGCTSLVE
jgi:hypothetical protein